jgi:hypothetical protein
MIPDKNKHKWHFRRLLIFECVVGHVPALAEKDTVLVTRFFAVTVRPFPEVRLHHNLLTKSRRNENHLSFSGSSVAVFGRQPGFSAEVLIWLLNCLCWQAPE